MAQGRSRAEALEAVGLTPPSDLSPHLHAATAELRSLWARVPPLTGWVKRYESASFVYDELIVKLRGLLE